MRLAMMAVGAVLVVRALRRSKSTDGDNQDLPSEEAFPSSGSRGPQLDPGFMKDPLVNQTWGGLFNGVVPSPGFQPYDPINNPPGLPVGMPGGTPPASQLSAANNMWNAIVGSIPYAVKAKIANIKTISSIHRRTASRVHSWHKRVFGF